MNHLYAKNKDNRWYYTYNGVPHGYCQPFKERTEEEIKKWFNTVEEYEIKYAQPRRDLIHKYDHDGHDTEEEAQNCFKQYLMDFELRFHDDNEKSNQLNRCQAKDCKEFTSGSAQIYAYYHYWSLCKNHRNKETVNELLQIGESWQS